MLCSLRLRNIATISDTTLELSGGLNVLTGETGAGKSILVDGLLLALGERADHSIVRPGEKLATVEALFQDGGSELLVRREVFASGRSRILLDDELTDLETTRERMGELVDLHTQRSTPALLSRRVQQAFLDARAGILETASEVRGSFRRLGQIDQRTAELESEIGASGSRRELLEHEASILGSLSPSREEYLDLSERRRRVEKDLKLRESLSMLSDLLSPEEGGFLKALRERRMELEKAQGLEEMTELVREAEIAIEEASRICSSRLGAADESWSVGDMDARLDEYGRLLGRYGGDIDRLMSRVGEVAAELGGMAAMEEELTALSAERASVASALAEGSGRLSLARTDARPAFVEGVTAELARLGMKGAVFDVVFGAPPRDRSVTVEGRPCCSDGFEVPEFRFSANPGMPPGPLQSVPSGGELSRLSLAIKLAQSGPGGATTIFDEIDSGVGGTVAHLLADSLARASKGRQFVVITHLAQIAARADRHLSVVKDSSGGLATTSVALQEGEDRVAEIARMLGGSEAAVDHARALLGGCPA
ncbi:MAG TPA: AAA family ATPase [Candidatus Fermentibacter daniensis]|nr:AAA family ATPase [Candidatus Fermentibacter daniensis]